MDYEERNDIGIVMRTLRGVVSVDRIPMGCYRAYFKGGSNCKIKAGRQLVPIARG